MDSEILPCFLKAPGGKKSAEKEAYFINFCPSNSDELGLIHEDYKAS